MKIEQGNTVAIEFQLYVDGPDGELIDETDEGPMIFILGKGDLLPAFEDQLLGLQVGDHFSFGLECEKAFGAEREDLVIEFPISEFEVDGVLDNDLLQPESVVPMQDEDGNVHHGIVVQRTMDTVTIDLNHPLAGEDVHYKGKVVSVTQ